MDELPCEPPDEGEVGEEWYCPDCARKYYCVVIFVDNVPTAVAWLTDEVN